MKLPKNEQKKKNDGKNPIENVQQDQQNRTPQTQPPQTLDAQKQPEAPTIPQKQTPFPDQPGSIDQPKHQQSFYASYSPTERIEVLKNLDKFIVFVFCFVGLLLFRKVA